jgi:hypothetical protein
MPRDKHPRKGLEKLLREAEARDCRVETRGKGKPFKVKCPCPEGHYETIHRTPGQSYEMRKRNILEGWPCWGTKG